MAAVSISEQIANLIYDYARCIDEDRLEELPDFFVEDCLYKVMPRENAEYGMPLAIIFCDNRNMLRDRILILRKAAVYNLHYDRHMISNVRVFDEADGIYHVHANYVVYHTDLEGESRVFSTGRYDDKVRFENGTPKFMQKIVTVDTYSVRNPLSAPL